MTRENIDFFVEILCQYTNSVDGKLFLRTIWKKHI
nr:MAG TPA: hypothetical protein [Caudoviricetes sp.]